MQKALINMNLRLDNALSDVSGVTGMAIIKAILNGERDPKKLATYRDRRCKKSLKEIEDSLNGFYQDDQLFALGRALRQYEFHLSEIETCDKMIQDKLSEFETHANYETTVNIHLPKKAKRSKKQKTHEFSFNLKDEMIQRACRSCEGVDCDREGKYQFKR